MAIVAQLGGGHVVGAGGFFIQFTAPELGRRKPLFLALAAGAAVGGSIGSAVSIPWSEVVRRLINPDAVPTPRDDLIFSPLDGRFTMRDIHGAKIEITQIGGSLMVVGAQLCLVRCLPWSWAPKYVQSLQEALGKRKPHFLTQIQIPTDLPSVGRALADIPQLQGGLGWGAFAFEGPLWHIG